MRDLTMSEVRAVSVAARAIKCEPTHLAALINFESGWNPQAKNPHSSARGLIQWVDSTARGLGYESSLQIVELLPTCEGQLLGPVIQHFHSISRTFPTLQSLCMAVFYPKARNWAEERSFPPHVQAQNPGIVTVGDYLAKVRKRPG